MDILPNLQRFQPYLLKSERVLWSGQPKQGFALSAKDIFLIPFSLLWGGFAIFWNAIVWLAPFGANTGEGPGWLFKLWGLPFLFVGIYLIAGRFIHDAQIRKSTLYGVTDQRILVLRRSRIKSLDLRRLPYLELSEHRDGTGTLAFEGNNNWSYGMNGLSWWLPSGGGATQFFRIENPRRIYELVRDQANG
jgi:hypothetical protein